MTDDKKAQSEDKKAKAPELTPEQERAAEVAARPDSNTGIDGINPVTPNNPPRGSQPDVARPHD